MKYERPAFKAEGVKTTTVTSPFFPVPITYPVPEFPISIKENFRRICERDNPVWVPNGSIDCASGMAAELTGAPEMDWGSKVQYDWQDWFGCEWRFVPVAGGSMLKPDGKIVCDDISEWKTKVTWPDLNKFDVEACCKKWMDVNYDSEKIISINIGQGCTERLVAILGGYEQAMVALALEPKACNEFFEAFVDFEIELFDLLMKYVPIDMITYHDDWGTERDTFFGERMMEEIVYKPTERLFNYIHSKGVYITFHSCGNVGRFMPYIYKLGPEFVQLQERANDLPGFKEKYGDKLGFNNFLPIPPDATKEQMLDMIHKLIENYGKDGGLFAAVMAMGEENVWDSTMELYYASFEYYEKTKNN